MEHTSIYNNTVTIIWFLFQIGSFELTYSDNDLSEERKQMRSLELTCGGVFTSMHSWMIERWKELTSTNCMMLALVSGVLGHAGQD